MLEHERHNAWFEAICAAGYHLVRLPTLQSLIRSFPEMQPALVVLTDAVGGTWPAIEAAALIRKAAIPIPILLVAGYSSESTAIAALKAGVNDYLKQPVSGDDLLKAVQKLIDVPRQRATAQGAVPQIIGDSPALRCVSRYAAQLALTNSTVLINGETGTGKELVAQMIHSLSARRRQPFLALNCAAVPDSLLESELFGRERGAYTGAETSYDGKLKLADGGTVLFDEIGDLTPLGQAKLLRVLESRRAPRLGSAREIPFDLRIMAATNQNLANMVEAGQFRRDLYFRLNVARVELPSLRARREDIPLLASHFARDFEVSLNRRFPGFTSRALKAMTNYDWPGNVRQLRNVVEELFVRLPDGPVDVVDLPAEITGRQPLFTAETTDERTRIVSALTSTRWNKKRAAERLCWSRMTLYRKMALHQIADKDGEPDNALSQCDSTCDTVID